MYVCTHGRVPDERNLPIPRHFTIDRAVGIYSKPSISPRARRDRVDSVHEFVAGISEGGYKGVEIESG